MSDPFILAAALARLAHTEVAVALHRADPEPGDMATNEVVYGGYARVNIAPASPGVSIDFPLGTGGEDKATHYSVGSIGGGAAEIFFSGPLAVAVALGAGTKPHIWTRL